jgi:hypothetical protein
MMDYSEAMLKLNMSIREVHDAINKKDWLTVDIESDNIVFLAKQMRDSVADLHTK